MDYIELAKKLKALADRGEGGEKFNADAKLKELMKKHGITEEQLLETTRSIKIFPVQRKHEKIFIQMVASIIGSKRVYNSRRSRKAPIYYIELTTSEELEIRAQFDFWSRVYDEEMSIFVEAFIQRHQLVPHDTKSDSTKDMTAQERKRMRKMFDMAQAIEERTFTRDLPEKIE